MTTTEIKTPLRRAREKANKTIGEAAAIVGSDVGNLSRIERGIQTPSRELTEKLAARFGISELEILYPERYTAETTANHV